jgi:hypothetical protein
MGRITHSGDVLTYQRIIEASSPAKLDAHSTLRVINESCGMQGDAATSIRINADWRYLHDTDR